MIQILLTESVSNSVYTLADQLAARIVARISAH